MKFNVIACHPYTAKGSYGCNMNCPFCYVPRKRTEKTKDYEFWYGLIPFFKQLTPQVAMGADGEPFMDIEFIKEFSRRCKEIGLIYNVTTNGRLLMNISDEELKDALKSVTLISISWDSYKVKTTRDMANYFKLVQRIKKLTGCQIGCNLLIDVDMKIIPLVRYMFEFVGVHRVFALYPKNSPIIDIHKLIPQYAYLSAVYEHFYVDDLSKQMFENRNYDNWKTTCHRGKGLISVDSEGGVCTCSYAKPYIYLDKPEDIMKLDIPEEEKGRNFCPFLGEKKQEQLLKIEVR